jgi:shikimate dehydrogenase
VRITAQTRVAGVVGNPVRHSLSPIIHNAWLEAAGLDAVYLAFEPPMGRFRQFVEGLRGGIVNGLNVTIPFKEDALARADEATERAARAGAANLLLPGPGGTILADDTDGVGLIYALSRTGWRAANGPAVILGAGGAARGAAAALLEAGVSKVSLVNRTVDRAQQVARLDARISAHGWDEAPSLLEQAALLVNATSLGMSGEPLLELALDPLPTAATVMDMVYRPLRTPLLQAAAARGNLTADGLDMLIGQAHPSFTAMFGDGPPEIDVRSLCLRALGESP